VTATGWHPIAFAKLGFSWVLIAMGAFVAVLVTPFAFDAMSLSKYDSYAAGIRSIVIRVFSVASIILLFVACRLGTLRTMQQAGDSSSPAASFTPSTSTYNSSNSVLSTHYNHREGDELVFEVQYRLLLVY
jgi:hypothetical protein